MSRRVSADDFTGAVTTQLKFLSDAVWQEVQDVIRDEAKEARDKLKVEGGFQNRSGKYRKGWKVTFEENRYSLKAIVHNKSYPLTHLLESGHAKVLWGRDTGGTVQAFPHIENVNNEVQEKLVEEIARRINDL